MRKALLLSLSLFAAIQVPSLGQEVTVKPGDTLSAIAYKHNISVRSLMDQNEIFNADSLQVGQTLTLPESAKLNISANNRFHTVKAGESLSKIADNYNLDKASILALNNFNNPDVIYLGQEIMLPDIQGEESLNSTNKKPNYHVVQKGENLSIISKTYSIPINSLININNISNPSVIKPGEKISLVEGLEYGNAEAAKENTANSISTIDDSINSISTSEEEADWRKYGSLKINWANWKVMNGSYVTPAINTEGKPLFLAINCDTTRMNNTGEGNQWKQWFAPSKEFEFNLLDDICKTNPN